MFDLHGNDRLTEWKNIRNNIEVSDSPFLDVANFWSKAPFVNHYINPFNVKDWPDPWHLILDGKYDDLAIVLGMLYTLKLTQRFMDTYCEIHMSMLPDEKTSNFFLVADNVVLNYEFRSVCNINILDTIKTNKIWSGTTLP